jgi:DNA-binding PadR family transcriptional regulator
MHGPQAVEGSMVGGLHEHLAHRLRMAMAARGGFGGHGFGHRGPGPSGFPFGGFRGRGFGHRPKRMGHGDVRGAILVLLSERPMHGYQIIQEIGERSEGLWNPSPGSVYPALQQLEDEGLVRVEKAEGRKVAHLTDEGDTYVREHREELGAPWETAAEDYGEDLLELRNLVGQVATATMQVAQAGDSGQISEARRLLTDVRRQLYRVLAGDDTTSS